MHVQKSMPIAEKAFSKRHFSANLSIMNYAVPEKLSELSNIFRSHGYSLYLVGGAVRDYILGNQNHDYDFTTDATPLEIKSMFRKTIDTGIKHGTVTVLFKGESYEITTFRSEGEYHDGRHPDSVMFIRSLDEDLRRRDFTINALAADLESGMIIDQHGGIEDIKRKRIKAIGCPEERFHEDGLRLMRACRFASKLDFDIDEETFNAIRKMHGNIASVSKERIKDELFRLIDGKAPSKGLEFMRESGLMDDVLPELSLCYGVEQGGFHREDVYTHLLLALEYANRNSFSLNVKAAALFHDIGKPECRREGENRYTFYGHDIASERITKEILDRLKASNAEKHIISHLVREHMFAYTHDWSEGAVRRFINRVGEKYLDDLFMLRAADRAATTGNMPADGAEEDKELRDRVRVMLLSKPALSLKDLKIDGNTLKRENIASGPLLGLTLRYLLSEVIEDPEKNEEKTLLSLSRHFVQCQGR